MATVNRPRCIGWRHGDLVSRQTSQTELTGRVVKLQRQSDGKPFLMVQVGVIGQRMWPDGWVLGIGPLQNTCVDCGQEFRSREERSCCPACDRDEGDDPHADTSRARRVRLRGNATPVEMPARRTLTQGEEAERAKSIAEQKAKDDAESPY